MYYGLNELTAGSMIIYNMNKGGSMKLSLIKPLIFCLAVLFLIPGTGYSGKSQDKKTCKPYLNGTKKFDILKLRYKRKGRWVWEEQL